MSESAPAPGVKFAGSRVFASGVLILAAVLLTVLFWFPLWTGGGLVGSDTYAYYLPQKACFVDALRQGQLPLWNNRIGHGYPQVAESQTGVFYPPHWLVNPLFDLNTAFSASLVGHYVLAFLFTYLYARRLGLPTFGAALAGLVYTYGWFPPRICLEWAIIGGAWLPLALWSVESYFATQYWRYAFLLTVALALQMLAGHFMLAFITQLTVVVYIPLRIWFVAGDFPAVALAGRGRTCGSLALAILAAFLVAAVQLLPTWELKQLSQRQAVTAEHDPGFGYIPPRYLTQVLLPWVWYPDDHSFETVVTPGGSRTNRVEAHLYFGLIPLALALLEVFYWRHGINRRLAIWLVLGLAAMIYTTGCLLPVTRYLPGFSFFEGPGRFGIVTTFAAAILAGSGFGELLRETFRGTRALLIVIVFALTATDLYVVSRFVTFAYPVPSPPFRHLAASPLREFFARQPQPSRVFSEAKNLPSLLGVATIPTYLGLGPAQYFDPDLTLPEPLPYSTSPSPSQLDWFHRAGVTHFLSFGVADERAWSARLAWSGPDLFLNHSLGRASNEMFYLYELDGSRGRVAWNEHSPGQSARVTRYEPNRVVVEADSPDGGRLILTDLSFPGWEAAVDGSPVPTLMIERMYRGVDLSAGKHAVIWNYRPAVLYWGAGISLFTTVILLAVGHVRYWHPDLFKLPKRTSVSTK